MPQNVLRLSETPISHHKALATGCHRRWERKSSSGAFFAAVSKAFRRRLVAERSSTARVWNPGAVVISKTGRKPSQLANRLRRDHAADGQAAGDRWATRQVHGPPASASRE